MIVLVYSLTGDRYSTTSISSHHYSFYSPSFVHIVYVDIGHTSPQHHPGYLKSEVNLITGIFFIPKTTSKSARHCGSIKLAKVHTRTAYSHTHARKGLVGQQKHSSVFIYGCSLLGPCEADTVGGGNSPGNQPSNNHRENWLIAKHHTC